MKVFLTGATGYIGSAVAEKLRSLGHHVVGLARSDSAAAKLEQHRIEPYRGDLFDAEGIIRGAESCDAVIHAASPNDVTAPRADQTLVSAVLKALTHSNKPFLYTSGVWVLGPTGDQVADENWPPEPAAFVAWRPAIERQVLHAASLGIR